jgi:predicted PurR-regulated permease PerM
VELFIALATLLILFVIFSWVLKLVKTTLKTVLLVVFMLLALYFVFGIGPDSVWNQLQNLLRTLFEN